MALIDQVHEQGQTIIMVTHEPDIARHCNRVIRLEDGKIESDIQQVRHVSS
jgi:putative ABC transport system ATP-binding protein